MPRTLRGAAAVTAVLGVAGTTVLGWWFAGDTHAGRVDRTLSGLVSAHSATGKAAEHLLTTLGEPVPVAVALGVLAVLGYRVRGFRGLVLVLAGPPLAMFTTSLVLKPLIDRTHDGGLAFPSGHTTAVASLAVTTAVLVAGWTVLPAVVRLLATVPLAGLVVAVGASLVGRHYHYPTDTLGGAGVAVAVVLVVALAVDPLADGLSDPPDTDRPVNQPADRPAGRSWAEAPTVALPKSTPSRTPSLTPSRTAAARRCR